MDDDDLEELLIAADEAEARHAAAQHAQHIQAEVRTDV